MTTCQTVGPGAFGDPKHSAPSEGKISCVSSVSSRYTLLAFKTAFTTSSTQIPSKLPANTLISRQPGRLISNHLRAFFELLLGKRFKKLVLRKRSGGG